MSKPDGLVDPEALAYAAGLFDGEGSVCITYSPANSRGNRVHKLHVLVINTDLRMLNWLQTRFGGHIKEQAKGPLSRRICWNWQPGALQAETFLRSIRPYSIGKSAQIDVALAFRSTVTRSRRPVGAAIEAERQKMRHELSVLNKG